jgi:ubiquitin-conjugating enzyme E2 S
MTKIYQRSLLGLEVQVRKRNKDIKKHVLVKYYIDGTPYEGGYFKIRLVLDESFPDTPPKGYFITKIFHPNVSSLGEICVNTLKKDWKPELGIEHILLVTCMF